MHVPKTGDDKLASSLDDLCTFGGGKVASGGSDALAADQDGVPGMNGGGSDIDDGYISQQQVRISDG